MEQRKLTLKGVQIEIRRSPRLLKILLSLLIVFSMGTLVSLRWIHLELQAQTQQVLYQADRVAYDNRELSRLTKNADTLSGVREIARRELGLVDPNTVLIDPS